jgi:hypothetical protein
MSKKNYRIMILISSVMLLSLVLAACGGAEPKTEQAESFSLRAV